MATVTHETHTDGTVRERQAPGRDGRSLGDLFSELTRETRDLVLNEVNLARTEVSEKISQVEKGVISMTTGGAVLYAGLLGLMASAILGLMYFVEPWLAALIVGGVVTVIGAIVLGTGKSKLNKDNLKLERTKRTLEEDKEWARAQVR